MKIARMASLVVATAVVLVSTAGAALAGTSYVSYNKVVPKLGGYVLSNAQTKAGTDSTGDLTSTTVGGGYVVNVCMSNKTAVCLPLTSKDISSGSKVKLANAWVSGAQVHAKFTSSWTTLVNVQVTGSWRSN